jgi:membrane associated rhomboid family serine protease
MISTALTLLIAATSILAFSNTELLNKLMFYPYLMNNNKGEWHRFIGHTFIHADWMHLIFNGIALYSFGGLVEQLLGPLKFLLLFFTAAVISSVADYMKHKENRYYRALGASGSVAAIIFASIIWEPWRGGIYMYFIPIPIPPIIFGVLYIAYSYYMSKRSSDNVAHNAHLYGALYGLLFTLLFLPNGLSNFLEKVINPSYAL